MPRPFALVLLVIGLTSTLSGTAATSTVRWVANTRSPQPAAAVTGADAGLYTACGARDLGLTKVAAHVARRRTAGKTPWSAEQLRELTRAAGVPQPWPRAWSVAGLRDDKEVARRLRRWVKKAKRKGYVRCGIARGADRQGRSIVAAVVVDAVADLTKFPTTARSAQWLKLDAVVHVAASSAKVVLLGPRGRPRRILTSLSHGHISSRFRLDAAGRWLVQVVVDTGAGPLPVLEAVTFVEMKTPTTLPKRPRAKPATMSARLWLTTQLNVSRKAGGVRALRRDSALDRVASKHAHAMIKQGKVAHDVGHGGPRQRVASAGIPTLLVGENVARATDVAAAHRALWSSPSHRENMLDTNFTRVGIASVSDGGGRAWVVQLFAR